ncbi:hypothetical protein POM88_005884 [Heracleum sosnowskyi]|uniref:Copia protein n=1 Tax=Heracleum sosnowskyi TaxID=360622 RepID=A0AAD8J2D2_9APIA|nr:hypothetical protein POM88_005884 [Heracleum sosnowskyi]
MESIHVSFDDKKITGLNEDSHDSLVFENEATKEPEEMESDTDTSSNLDDSPNPDDTSNPDDAPNTDGANVNDANNGDTTSSANVEGEQHQTATSSESTQTSGHNSSDTDSERNPVQHSLTKHISIRYHFIREQVLEGTTELHFVPIDQQLDDICTKPLPGTTFNKLVNELGMMNFENF